METPCLITATAELEEFIRPLSAEPFVAIDTEFIRERTYWPQLCLVQLAGSAGAAAIDPLSPGIDLSSLFALLSNPGVIKVFHAARQDIEIFYHLTGSIPSPLFDTQVAAQVLGFGESISYERLALALTGFELDKGSRFTDWAKRPLSARQLAYALDDVIHLRTIYEKLSPKLKARKRETWIMAEIEWLAAPATYDLAPEDAWMRMKAGNLKPRQLAALQRMAAWREALAKERNVPRGRIARDDALIELASALPHTLEEAAHLRSVGGTSREALRELFTHVEAVRELPSSELPSPNHRKRRQNAENDVVEVLQLLLKLAGARHDVLPRLVATRDDLERLSLGERNLPLLEGWRREVFGAEAVAFLEGRLCLQLDTGKGELVLK